MKVETTGDFMLLDINGGQEIASEGVTEVKETGFVVWALDEGLLKEVGKAKAEPEPNNDAPTSGRNGSGARTK